MLEVGGYLKLKVQEKPFERKSELSKEESSKLGEGRFSMQREQHMQRNQSGIFKK
jgi:hypothetical protein